IAALGVLSGCLIDVCVKYLASDINVFVLTVWRFIFGGGYALALFLALGRAWPRWEAWRFHTMRGVIHLVAALTFFYSLTQLGLAEATVMGFTAALMIAPIARVLLGERFGGLSVLAAGIGFAGAAITLSGDTGGAPPDGNRALGAAAVMVGAVTYATSVVLLRMRAQKEDTLTIVMLSNVLPAILGLPILFIVGAPPAASDFPVLALLGLFGLGIWWMFTLAYGRAPAQRLAPLEYTALIWSALFGWIVFGEVPGWPLYAGAAVIIGACLLVAFEGPILSAWKTRRLLRGRPG
ncbi:MAG: DMT family transporter, partial [Pseudomonadota bacterium]